MKKKINKIFELIGNSINQKENQSNVFYIKC
jgi:hypothetical protein